MAKRKKKTLSQKAVAVATPGLPRQVRNVLTSRLVAPLIVLIVGGLTATGVIKFEWFGGRPHVAVDEQRADEVGKQVERFVDDVQKDIQAEKGRSRTPRLSKFADELGGRR